MINVLAIGDVVGDGGCAFLRKNLPAFKKYKSVDICIANGENSAQGNGISPHSAENLFDSGVDLITTGNHTYRRSEIYSYLDSTKAVIRPANIHRDSPGKGYYIIDKGRFQFAVINLLGRVNMEPCDNPFDCVDGILRELEGIKCIAVDFHAEATGEKRALGFYLDGKVSAFFGTHTHVQTTDAYVLPKGTGYISDLGMTGPINSVLGIKPELAIEKMRTGLPVRFENPESECKLEGCLFEIDNKTGKALSCELVSIK